MLMSQTAEYALRAMAYLASLPPGQAIRAKDLAKITGIPVHYLSKIMRRLVEDGLIHSRRGHGGGFHLALAPADISFHKILAAVDCDPQPDRCAYGRESCNPENPCPLHSATTDLNEAYMSWTMKTTLADVDIWAPPQEPIIGESAKPLFFECLKDVQRLLPKEHDYGDWRRMSHAGTEELLSLVYKHLSQSDDMGDAFLHAEKKLPVAFQLVRHLDECRNYEDEVIFYQGVRKQILKTGKGKYADGKTENPARNLLNEKIEN